MNEPVGEIFGIVKKGCNRIVSSGFGRFAIKEESSFGFPCLEAELIKYIDEKVHTT